MNRTSARLRFQERLSAELSAIRAGGREKVERLIVSDQAAAITIAGEQAERQVINFCANNYLGLANDPRVRAAAKAAIDEYGAGLASVRFICGTQAIHKHLEAAIADYLGFEDAILFAAAFDANGGLFESLLGDEDAIVSDSLNHASIIDGVRLSRARRFRFTNGDMADLRRALDEARQAAAGTILIATDGVFSMDGHIARLDAIVELADEFGALVLVDDCHATGVIGARGRGSAAHCGVDGKVDLVTGTFGKALGGAMGGFVAASAQVIALLRQRARPYLFSNSLAPSICGAALAAIEIARSDEGEQLRHKLMANAQRLREGLTARGLKIIVGQHPIVPVMIGDDQKAQRLAAKLLDEGLYVTAFSYPVVPAGTARIRLQASAAHTPDQIDAVIDAFAKAAPRI